MLDANLINLLIMWSRKTNCWQQKNILGTQRENLALEAVDKVRCIIRATHKDDDVDPLFLAALIQLELLGGRGSAERKEGGVGLGYCGKQRSAEEQKMIILMASFGWVLWPHIFSLRLHKLASGAGEDETLRGFLGKTSSFFLFLQICSTCLLGTFRQWPKCLEYSLQEQYRAKYRLILVHQCPALSIWIASFRH